MIPTTKFSTCIWYELNKLHHRFLFSKVVIPYIFPIPISKAKTASRITHISETILFERNRKYCCEYLLTFIFQWKYKRNILIVWIAMSQKSIQSCALSKIICKQYVLFMYLDSRYLRNKRKWNWQSIEEIAQSQSLLNGKPHHCRLYAVKRKACRNSLVLQGLNFTLFFTALAY